MNARFERKFYIPTIDPMSEFWDLFQEESEPPAVNEYQSLIAQRLYDGFGLSLIPAEPSNQRDPQQVDFSNRIMDSIAQTQKVCSELQNEIEQILQGLTDMSGYYSEVIGRTKKLLRSCEGLLDEQVFRGNTLKLCFDFSL
jgi:hypothetical protein